jgi:hypothetical protein
MVDDSNDRAILIDLLADGRLKSADEISAHAACCPPGDQRDRR